MDEIIIDHIKNKLLVGQTNIELLAEDDLLESGLIDSIAVMRLISFIETEFDVKIPPQDMTIDNFISVEAMVSYLESIKN